LLINANLWHFVASSARRLPRKDATKNAVSMGKAAAHPGPVAAGGGLATAFTMASTKRRDGTTAPISVVIESARRRVSLTDFGSCTRDPVSLQSGDVCMSRTLPLTTPGKFLAVAYVVDGAVGADCRNQRDDVLLVQFFLRVLGRER
jgi:hypothetical protein